MHMKHNHYYFVHGTVFKMVWQVVYSHL